MGNQIRLPFVIISARITRDKMSIRFSIIIPHYNDLVGVTRLLESIPNNDEIEVLIIDDNSAGMADALKELTQQFAFELYFNTSGNKGAGACRNIGLNHAKGKWLIFADADDFFVEKAFDIIVQSVDEVKENTVDVVYFSPTSIYTDTGELANRHIPYESLVKDYLTNKNPAIRFQYFVPWSKVVRAEFVRQQALQFDEVIASNDVMFGAKVGILAKNISVSSETIYCVTRQKGSLTTQTNRLVRNTRLKVLIRYNEYLDKMDFKQYQDSFYGILKEYYQAMDGASFKKLSKLVVIGKLPVFPRSYVQYLTKPSVLLARLKTKKTNHHKDKKYLD